MSAGDRRGEKRPAVPPGGQLPATGQGSHSAMEAMLKKRQMRAVPDTDAPQTQEQQPQPPKPAPG